MNRRVEAFVTAVGFPQDLQNLDHMVQKNIEHGERLPRVLDIDLIIEGSRTRLNWSVPPWAQPGDIAVFYCTVRSRASASRLRRDIDIAEIESEGSDESEIEELRQAYREILDHAVDRAALFAGRFVAVGRVASWPYDGAGAHFRDRLFADIDDVVVLSEPVLASEIRDVFQVRRAATISRMNAEAFGAFKRVADPQLPRWARAAKIGLDAHPKANWRDLVSNSEYRPRTEDEFREFVVTPLLEELSGSADGILVECRTMRRGKWTGYVDNLVRIADDWIPIECKLRIPSEKAMLRQAKRYIGCSKAIGTLGFLRGSEIRLSRSATCWILDASGLYLMDRSGFVECDIETPLHRLGELALMPIARIGSLLSGETSA